MMRTVFSAALLVSLLLLISDAAAQKNELTGIIGRTFVSDQGVKGVSPLPTRFFTPEAA